MNELPKGLSIVWTRELLLKAAGFDHVEDLRRALTRTREALNATAKGRPDHLVRLKATDQVYELADVKKPREHESPDFKPVINIAIITSEHHAPGAPETNGRAIRIVSGEGDGA